MVRNQKVTQCYHVYAMCHGDTYISKPQQKKIFCHKKIFRCKKIFSSDKNIIWLFILLTPLGQKLWTWPDVNICYYKRNNHCSVRSVSSSFVCCVTLNFKNHWWGAEKRKRLFVRKSDGGRVRKKYFCQKYYWQKYFRQKCFRQKYFHPKYFC